MRTRFLTTIPYTPVDSKKVPAVPVVVVVVVVVVAVVVVVVVVETGA